MKTRVTSFALLACGILFSGRPLLASGKSRDAATPMLAEESTPVSGLNSSARTNGPINDTQLAAAQNQRERLNALFTPLNELLAKYPEKDRRVRATRKLVAELQEELAENSTATKVANPPTGTNESLNLVSMETLDDKHRLAIGDKLSFRIEEDKYRLATGEKLNARSEEEPTPLLVTDSGELEVPYIGRYPAENKTCKQLACELKAALEKDYFYQATVIVAVDLKTKSRGRVYLNGAVHSPGPQEVPSDEILTLGKAILRAGGFTDFAERHNVRVTRQVGTGPSNNKTLVVDVAQVFDKGRTELDLPLEPGDLILVSERLIRF